MENFYSVMVKSWFQTGRWRRGRETYKTSSFKIWR